MQNKYYNQADTTLGNFAPGGLAVQIPPDFRIGAMRLMYSMSRTN